MDLQFTGRSTFIEGKKEAGNSSLVLGVRIQIEGFYGEIDALLDTGAQWSVLPNYIADALGFDTGSEDEDQLTYLTKEGAMNGRLGKVQIKLIAEEGEPLEIEATCFITDAWNKYMVLGWYGCLECLRFGFNPADSSFYFAVNEPGF